MSSNTKTKVIGRKRRRGQQQSFDKERELKKLVSGILTTIRREGKVAKKHEIQKLVKRLKQLQEPKSINQCDNPLNEHQNKESIKKGEISDGPDSSSAQQKQSTEDKSQKKILQLESRLEKLKSFDVDELMKLCMKRLGMKMFGVNIEHEVEKERKKIEKLVQKGTKANDPSADSNCETGEGSKTMVPASDDQCEIAEALLIHKNLVKAMNSLDERVGVFRREILRQQGENIPSEATLKRKQLQKNGQDDSGNWSKRKQAKTEDLMNQGGSMFLGSLSGEMPEGSTPNPYGPAGDMDDLQPQKKNRMGQRARRAKMMAEEAKRTGRQYESLNWRPKKAKPKKDDDHAEKNNNTASTKSKATEASSQNVVPSAKDLNAAQLAEMGKSWKEEGKAHPSWVAKQRASQQSGIASFAGKRITFD